MKKPGFTLEQHRQAGRDLKAAERHLRDFVTQVTPAYPKSSRAGKALVAVAKARVALMKAKSEMDEQVVRDFPDLELSEFVPINYGSEK